MLPSSRGHKCHAIKLNDAVLDVTEIEDLETTQKEADTQILLHAAYASKSCSDLVIRIPDTDVVVLSLAFCPQIDSHLYFHTVKGRKTHITDVILVTTNVMPLYSRSACFYWM